MTAQEIEQAARESFPSEGYGFTYITHERERKGFIAGAEWMQSQQPYTAEDMSAFTGWCITVGSILRAEI